MDKMGETTTVWSLKQRGAPILKGTGPTFKWSDEAGMHVSCEPEEDPKLEAKIDAALSLRDKVFSGHLAMHYGDLISTLMRVTEKTMRTAERHFDFFRKRKLIKKSVAKLWVPVN
jgi:hypothetical protein